MTMHIYESQGKKHKKSMTSELMSQGYKTLVEQFLKGNTVQKNFLKEFFEELVPIVKYIHFTVGRYIL